MTTFPSDRVALSFALFIAIVARVATPFSPLIQIPTGLSPLTFTCAEVAFKRIPVLSLFSFYALPDNIFKRGVWHHHIAQSKLLNKKYYTHKKMCWNFLEHFRQHQRLVHSSPIYSTLSPFVSGIRNDFRQFFIVKRMEFFNDFPLSCSTSTLTLSGIDLHLFSGFFKALQHSKCQPRNAPII